MKKRFSFKAKHGSRKIVAIDATTFADAVRTYQRIYPDALIAYATTKPEGRSWRPVWLGK